MLDFLAVAAAVRAAVGLPDPETRPAGTAAPAPAQDPGAGMGTGADSEEHGGGTALSHPGWSDENGSWISLVLPGEGRALIAGWHAEESETEASGTSLDGGTDLIDVAPGWWRRGIDHARARGDVLGFLYGWDGSSWWRAPYDTADGFDPDFFPVSRETVAELVNELAADTLLDDPSSEALDALLAAGVRLDGDTLSAALRTEDGWPEVDTDAGVRTARAFAEHAARLSPAAQNA